MTFPAVNLPDAKDLDTLSINPRREFEDCTGLLSDPGALNRFYDENGYLFFRNALTPDSVAKARDEMLAVAADHYGIADKSDPTARWNGNPLRDYSEEGPEFAGIAPRLISDPKNSSFIDKIMGERACMVPIVQYRTYPPGGPVTSVHQDGFYSPGIQDYRPVWIPLIDCPRNVGGLTVAVGEHKRGYLHNLGKPTPFPIPEGFIDPDSWATADFKAGDVLIVHPCAPHAAMPNTSDQLRVTLDTRVQSATSPSAFSGEVKTVSPTSVTIIADDKSIGEVTLVVSESTYIRTRDRTVRERFGDFSTVTVPGMRLVAVRDGTDATMLRCATNP